MNLQFKVRPWVWGVLAVVLAGGLGFTAWYFVYVRGEQGTPLASPTPTKTAISSPKAGTTATPTSPTSGASGEQPSTPSSGETSTPIPAGNTFSGVVKNEDYDVSYNVTLTVPEGFTAEQIQSSIYLSKGGKKLINMYITSWFTADAMISNTNKNNLSNPYEVSSSPANITVAGYPAEQWIWGQSDPNANIQTMITVTSGKRPLIINGDLSEGLSRSDHDSVLNSLIIQ